jgi:hypothetical protein
MTPGELREKVLARDRHCVWPGCVFEVSGVNPLECAHLTHRGMGGAEDRNNLANAVALCKMHHDVLDGRQGLAKTRAELVAMLRATHGRL